MQVGDFVQWSYQLGDRVEFGVVAGFDGTTIEFDAYQGVSGWDSEEFFTKLAPSCLTTWKE